MIEDVESLKATNLRGFGRSLDDAVIVKDKGTFDSDGDCSDLKNRFPIVVQALEAQGTCQRIQGNIKSLQQQKKKNQENADARSAGLTRYNQLKNACKGKKNCQDGYAKKMENESKAFKAAHGHVIRIEAEKQSWIEKLGEKIEEIQNFYPNMPSNYQCIGANACKVEDTYVLLTTRPNEGRRCYEAKDTLQEQRNGKFVSERTNLQKEKLRINQCAENILGVAMTTEIQTTCATPATKRTYCDFACAAKEDQIILQTKPAMIVICECSCA
jgi:hypothetical protein